MEQEVQPKQEILLELNDLSVRYADASDAVLKEINLSLHAAEIVCVIGESGSGKSTLFQSVLQLSDRVKITEGSILFRGEDLRNLTKRQWHKIRGNGIGVVFQEPGASLDPTRKIFRQFYDAMRAHDRSMRKADARIKAENLLKSMEFSDPDRILDSCPVQLSGGMNQRVAIALAMALNPAILLADEPTSALDVTVQAQVVKELMELRKKYGTAILLITHNMGVAAKMADQIAVMRSGQIVECGTKEEVLSHPKHPYTKELLAAVPRLYLRKAVEDDAASS